jgi:hypothetical protein
MGGWRGAQVPLTKWARCRRAFQLGLAHATASKVLIARRPLAAAWPHPPTPIRCWPRHGKTPRRTANQRSFLVYVVLVGFWSPFCLIFSRHLEFPVSMSLLPRRSR